jgi:DNA-binding transcriptional regulator YiaG
MKLAHILDVPRNGARMSAQQFRETIDVLGLTQNTAALVLGVHARTTRRWANGERAIPGPVDSFLQFLMDARVKAANAVRTTQKQVSKPKARKAKSCGVGPTYVAAFGDGTTVRMTTATPLDKLNWQRGERLAIAAYQSRVRRARFAELLRSYKASPWGRDKRLAFLDQQVALMWEPIEVPPIVAAHFEQAGKVLAHYSPDALGASPEAGGGP